MNSESLILKEILEARENRAKTQRELINIFRTTVVSFTLNIPGPEKTNSILNKVHEKGIWLLEEELGKQNINIVGKVVKSTAAGDEAFFTVDVDAINVKKVTASIEDKSELGRLFDFDVFTADAKQVSRSEIGLSERKCLLCNDSAKVCGRGRKHSINDLLNKIYQIIKDCK